MRQFKKNRRLPAAAGIDFILYLLCGILLLLAVPSFMGLSCYTVLSGSMEPALPTGCAVYVKKVPCQEIKDGEIIAFLAGEQGMRVTHRVVKADRKNKCFVTKGDANDCPDSSPVSWEAVCGKVVFSLPVLGYVQGFLGNRRGKIAAFCLLAGLLALSEIFKKEKGVCQK